MSGDLRHELFVNFDNIKKVVFKYHTHEKEINALANMELPDVTKMTLEEVLNYTKRDQ